MATYNPYNDAYSIYKLKNSWHEADAKGDTATKDKSAKEAQAYYQSLIKNGYSDIAEKLQKTDNKGAKDVIKNLISSVEQPTGDEWYQNNLKELQSNPKWTDGVKTGSSTGVQTVKSTMPEAKDTETITGKITAFTPYCVDGCHGYVASGKFVGNGDIYQYDHEYGMVRIVAGDPDYPFGTIVKMKNLGYFGGDVYAIVLDRGGAIGKNRRAVFDILFATEENANRFGVAHNIECEILRIGY
jgi:3D (Asp-Asp-Asp) domain-containing protein